MVDTIDDESGGGGMQKASQKKEINSLEKPIKLNAYHSCMACTQNCRYFIFTFVRISNSIIQKWQRAVSLFAKSLSFRMMAEPNGVTHKKYAFSFEWNVNNRNLNCDLIRGGTLDALALALVCIR